MAFLDLFGGHVPGEVAPGGASRAAGSHRRAARRSRVRSSPTANVVGIETIEGGDFRNDDWYGDEFTDRAYLRCTFSHVDLTEASTRGVVFEDCTFHNAKFNASRHTDSAFLRCVFKSCNMFDAEFDGCKLVGSQFPKSQLRPLRVTGGDWSFTVLHGLDLRGTVFRDVRMREVDLTNALCEGAVVSNVDLSGALMERVDFTDCDLRGSDLTALDPFTVKLRGAKIDGEQAIVVAQALGLKVS